MQVEALAAGAGNTIQRGPANTPAVADPSLAVAGQAGKERQCAVAAVGLRPKPLARNFIPAQVKGAALGSHAVVVALAVLAGQQGCAAGAPCKVGSGHGKELLWMNEQQQGDDAR